MGSDSLRLSKHPDRPYAHPSGSTRKAADRIGAGADILIRSPLAMVADVQRAMGVGSVGC